MKLFTCQHCDQVLYFENVRCEKCGHRLGYLAETNVLSALEPAADAKDATPGQPGVWQALAARGKLFRFCANAAYHACNWLIPADAAESYCIACRHNRTVPDLTPADNVFAWRKLEMAKHRLFYTCSSCACHWPIVSTRRRMGWFSTSSPRRRRRPCPR